MKSKTVSFLLAFILSFPVPAQPAETALENAPVSGPQRQFWNLVLRPAPVSVPYAAAPLPAVQVVLSAHGSARDAEWCSVLIRRSLRDVPADVPVFIWLEHAYPGGMPDTVRGLQRKIPSAAGSAVNWQRELLENTLPHETEIALRDPFERARRKEDLFPEKKPFLSDDFMRKIHPDLTALAGNPWKIRILREEPSFEAYVEDLRRDALGRMTEYWREKGRKDLALASLALAYRRLKRSLWIRDQALADSIAEIQASHPDSVHFIVRGLAHIETLGKSLSLAGIKHKDSLQTGRQSRIQSYLIRHGALPSAETVTGISFLNEELARLR
ncbi:MAG: hypothetical protein HY714_05100 [Candidatus Omnitrophica bacterium]|nr:hypothetical protein [Candidatus Omnitrophota bacterium]